MNKKRTKLTPSILTGVPIQTHRGDGTLTEAGIQEECFKWLKANRNIKLRVMGTANIENYD